MADCMNASIVKYIQASLTAISQLHGYAKVQSAEEKNHR